MNLDSKRHDPDIVLSDTALDWLVTLHSGRATDADRASFTEWRGLSKQHELAAREAEAIWQGVGIAGGATRDVERKAAQAKLTRRAVIGGGAVAMAGLAIGGSGILDPFLFADHTTGVGEQRTVTLTDGSTVGLNARTALSVDFNDKERNLKLFQGEAIFTVAHDAARPFIVQARGGRTLATGTVFNIDMRPDEVAVTVVEGAVQVTMDAVPVGAVNAKGDQRVRYGRGQVSATEAINSDVETAWRRGKLIFNRRPLRDVVAEIKRYRSGQIVIASADLRALEVTGVFELADPEAILRTIEETLPVRVTQFPFVTVIR
ncbi:MAG TPA: FecR family protein [Afipia sp.]